MQNSPIQPKINLNGLLLFDFKIFLKILRLRRNYLEGYRIKIYF